MTSPMQHERTTAGSAAPTRTTWAGEVDDADTTGAPGDEDLAQYLTAAEPRPNLDPADL
jgi:hypothetical protein